MLTAKKILRHLACGIFMTMAVSAYGQTALHSGISSSLRDSLYQMGLPRTAVLTDADYDILVYINIDQQGQEDWKPSISSLYVFDKKQRKLSKLFTTTPATDFAWYNAHGTASRDCQFTDIHDAYDAKILPYHKKLVVDGCFDFRNTFSYLIDLETQSVKLLPTNAGLCGFTGEEGYIVMNSYAYNNALTENGDPAGGRHTVLSIFDENGVIIKMIDLEQLP